MLVGHGWRLVGVWAAIQLVFVTAFVWAGHSGETMITLFGGLVLLFGGYYAAWQAHAYGRWDHWRVATPRWLSLLCARRATQLAAPLAVFQVSLLGGSAGLVWALATSNSALTYTVTGLVSGAMAAAALWALWFLWRYIL